MKKIEEIIRRCIPSNSALLFEEDSNGICTSLNNAIEQDAKTDAIASFFLQQIRTTLDKASGNYTSLISEIFANPLTCSVIQKLEKTASSKQLNQELAIYHCKSYCEGVTLKGRKMSPKEKERLLRIAAPYACLMFIAKVSKVDSPTSCKSGKKPDGIHTSFTVPISVSNRTSNRTAEDMLYRLEEIFSIPTPEDGMDGFRLNWPPNVEIYLRSMSSIVLLERRLRVLRYMCLAHSMFSTDKATFHLNLVLLNKKTDILKKGYPLVQGNLVQEDPAVPVLLEENALVLQAYLSEESVMSKEGSEHSLIDVFTEDQIREIKDLKKTQTEMYRDQLNSNPSLLFSWLEEDLSQAKYFELLESHYFDDQLAELVEMAIKVPGRNTVITRIRHMCDLLEDLEKWADAYNEVSRLSKPTASHNQIKDLEDELARVNAEILKRTSGE